MSTATPAQAQAAVAEVVAEARQEGAQAVAEIAKVEVAAVVADAAAKVEAAEQTSEALAAALANTQMSERLNALEKAQGDNAQWREALASLQTAMSAMASTLETISRSVLTLTEVLLEEVEEPESTPPRQSSTPGENPPLAEDAAGPEKPKRVRLLI